MVKLALLWHMHQPSYEDMATGEHILPWVRMHGIKDYRGMVEALAPFPSVRVTFNLVPSLLTQLQAFADDRAHDRHLSVGLCPAAQLTPDDRAFLVANGFHAAWERMIAPYPRYAWLHAHRGAAAAWGESELRDLQVWLKLAWMDPDLLATDPRLLALVARGRDFEEHHKLELRAVELEILRGTVPSYRAALERGQVELSTSPFFHPILPLLCDTDVHRVAHPEAPSPRRRFSRPEDARAQVARARAFHTDLFGQPPAGLWPSEGSVSDAMVPIVAGEHIAWMATDEDVLARTLQTAMPRDHDGHQLRPDLLYRPYVVGGDAGRVACLFRDHALSDRIGFTYQSWDAVHAVDDWLGRVREAGRRYTLMTGGVATVAVILDGENAWEHYPGGGRPFLRELYGRLQAATDIQTVTMAEAAASPEAGTLASIFPGSWIYADFYIWAGHADDRTAWSQLADARDVFDRRAELVRPEARARAYDELLMAEGSDWFWWYGDDHSSDQDAEFDDLFRRHVRNVYDALGEPVPAELFRTNITTAAARDARDAVGAMHQVDRPQG